MQYSFGMEDSWSGETCQKGALRVDAKVDSYDYC